MTIPLSPSSARPSAPSATTPTTIFAAMTLGGAAIVTRVPPFLLQEGIWLEIFVEGRHDPPISARIGAPLYFYERDIIFELKYDWVDVEQEIQIPVAWVRLDEELREMFRRHIHSLQATQ
jgi:hypothetical protein